MDNKYLEEAVKLEESLDMDELVNVSLEDELDAMGFSCVERLSNYLLYEEEGVKVLDTAYEHLKEKAVVKCRESTERRWIWQNEEGACIVAFDNGNTWTDVEGTLSETLKHYLQ